MIEGKYEKQTGEKEIMWIGNVRQDNDQEPLTDMGLTNQRIILVRYPKESYQWKNYKTYYISLYAIKNVAVGFDEDGNHEPRLELYCNPNETSCSRTYFYLGTSEETTRIWAMAIKDYMEGKDYGKSYYDQMMEDNRFSRERTGKAEAFDTKMFIRFLHMYTSF